MTSIAYIDLFKKNVPFDPGTVVASLDHTKVIASYDPHLSQCFGTVMTVGDANGDGVPDLLFIGNDSGQNRLLKRNGAAFEDITQAAFGANVFFGPTYAAAFLQFEGHLQLYVGQSQSYFGTSTGIWKKEPNRLFTWDGAFFHEIEGAAGANCIASTMGIVAVDFDGDGDTDIFVVNDLELNRLYRNDGDRFTDVSNQLGTRKNRGMGVAVADFNGDGKPDVYIARVGDGTEGDVLYLNQGNMQFVDASSLWKVDSYSADQAGWSVITADVDRNGKPDVVVTHSWFSPGSAGLQYEYIVALNQGSEFKVVRRGDRNAAGAWGALLDDFDGDGSIDIAVYSPFQPLRMALGLLQPAPR